MRVALILVALIGGCALLTAPAVPQSARLSAERLDVTLTDGTVCRADWKAEGGSGQLDGCGSGFGYQVVEVAKPNLLRQLFVGVTDALGAEGAVPPMAEVTVSGNGRDWRFVSPPPAD